MKKVSLAVVGGAHLAFVEFLQRNILVLPTHIRSGGEGGGDDTASLRRIDFLIHHTHLDCPVNAAGDGFVLSSQPVVEGFTLIVGGSGKGALVQDSHRGLCAHDCNLGIRPREHRRGAERP